MPATEPTPKPEAIRHNMQRPDWRPQYRNMGEVTIMVENVIFPDGAVGIIYRKGGRYAPAEGCFLETYPTRDEAARVEHAAALRAWADKERWAA